MPSELDYAWAAGIIDGDGCITLSPKGTRFRSPQVVVDSTDREILDALLSMFGGGIVEKRRYVEHHRQAASWRLYGPTSVLGTLRLVTPFMRCQDKLARALLLLAEYENVTRRNGRYTNEQAAAKVDFEERFMALGSGRGSSLRTRPRPIVETPPPSHTGIGPPIG